MKLKHTAVWVGFTAATLLAASACSAETTKKAAEAAGDAQGLIKAALTRATDRTQNLGSADVRMTTDLGNGSRPVTMDGTYSWGHGFAFDAEMDTKAAQMGQLHAAPKTRTIFVDGAYYYDIDPQPSGPLKGKEWMKIDASAIFGEKGAQALGGSSGAGSPAASMRGLKYASNVDDLGKETVDGQLTHHYKAVIDRAHMGRFKEAYGNQDNLFNSMTGGGDSITMEVWVNDKDLPVRLTEEFGKATVTMDFEKFGATAAVKAPPATQTGDLTDAVKAQQQKRQQG
ncbi:hypothetical protein [Streptomyces sp. MK5]|uniref:hypothetical protein n=1 Tax=Streptomyces sp. MK5 TaxID=3064253 RepID=UPI0027404FDC|nr:hypothetical protein [Streptomyces sp. MK5]